MYAKTIFAFLLIRNARLVKMHLGFSKQHILREHWNFECMFRYVFTSWCQIFSQAYYFKLTTSQLIKNENLHLVLHLLSSLFRATCKGHPQYSALAPTDYLMIGGRYRPNVYPGKVYIAMPASSWPCYKVSKWNFCRELSICQVKASLYVLFGLP